MTFGSNSDPNSFQEPHKLQNLTKGIVIIMKLNDAIIKRIQELCEERKINVCDASLKGGMSPSAIYDLFKGRTKCSKVITVKRFCEGAGITLKEFFDREYFNDMEE